MTIEVEHISVTTLCTKVYLGTTTFYRIRKIYQGKGV